jgi:protein SCO1/2
MKLLALLSLLAGLLIGGNGHAISEKTLPIHDGVGGEFSAQSSVGREVSLSEYRGKVVLLFFGYTSCQDICPATLAHLQSLMKRIGVAADNVQVLLVTVDPENDSPEHLREYLAQFDSRFVGLTGKREETDRIAELFMVKYHQSHGVKVSTEYNRSKAFAEHSYLYSHSQQIYLLDKAGRTRALFFVGSPLGEMQEAVLALLDEETAERDPTERDCGPGGTACPDDPTDHQTHQGME